MPLDSNLFVLLVRPRAASPGWIDFLVDRTAEGGTADEVAYSVHKDPSTSTLTLLDPLTLSPLGSHSLAPPPVPNAPPNPRIRLIRLDSPSAEVTLRSRSGLSWCWEMEWEGASYVWERDVGNPFSDQRGFTLLASRKPDPNYPVASFSPKKKSGSIEVYDYNLSRIEPPIQDKKGLEITTLLALSFFIDPLFNLPSSDLSSSSSSPSPSPAAASVSYGTLRKVPPPVPSIPPSGAAAGRAADVGGKKPATGLVKLDVNEVEVVDASPAAVEEYCARCLTLLEDPTLLYLVLFTTPSSSPSPYPSSPASSPSLALVPAVAALAERVKRERYKKSGEELLLFVDDEGGGGGGAEVNGATGGGRGGKSFPTPPTSLRCYLSRIELSELLPNHRSKRPSSTAKGGSHTSASSPPPGPPIRPPIDFGAAAAGAATGAGGGNGGGGGESAAGGARGGSGASGGGGGWRAFFGGGGGGGGGSGGR
ncbi:hypothetical protein JCM6882_000054 [Rhodosporidiobolus microsporus]